MIIFKENQYRGHVTCTWPQKRADKAYRLLFGDDLKTELEKVFLMSVMRDTEKRLRTKKDSAIERDIPFWEFLDIEFDEETKTVHMTAHYTQIPTFPKLFHSLTSSPIIKRIDDELKGKDTNRIYKQDWRPREELKAEIGAENVIYMLIDTKEKLLYVGEADRLIQRLQRGHSSIKKWNFYRYDVLPEALREFRKELERMVIRIFATVLLNERDIQTKEISKYRLANKKIDL